MADQDSERTGAEGASLKAESSKAAAVDGPMAPDVEKASTPTLVDWDGTDDPQNPMNWSKKKKWSLISLVAYITFVT